MEKEATTLVAVAVAAIAAIASIFGSAVLAAQTYRSSQLQVHAQVRSANRKAWMNRVMADVRDLVATCRHKPGKVETLTRLATELDLLLNPEDVIGKTRKAVDACNHLKQTLQEIRGYESPDQWHDFSGKSAKELVQPVKVILAQEWQLVMRQQ